ncbi:basement membrane-specific heparan sulfate proteoglycan core protein isoform X4 [Dendroctonus ponderosae]|uniref:basement membrane-specific heparan sulfate proteoglycan core protein isoform X4 n=1 Tax=Dendroctonus ponderosae TaxID=77166 RepID=UPI002034F4E6|nr:basement membrane-specific heparan sulfate proteoglycan core protein isoform X4 [Dendroctonus ponderosae]
MANLPRPRAHPKLLFGLVFCALLLPALTDVAADSQEDSDLVFDQFELPDLRTLRTARESDGYSYEESSQSSREDEEEQHWLSRTVNRIKRSIGNMFSPEEKHHKGHERLAKGHQKTEDTAAVHPNLIRNSRQSNFDINDEDEEENRLDEGPGLDDEDGLGSGMDGSGEISTVPVGFSPVESTGSPILQAVLPSAHPKYYRIIVTVEEYYADEFHDRISEAFHQLASKLEAGVQELFQGKPGEQIATVISIEQKKDDLFNVRATIDLESKGWTDNDGINKFIYDKIQDNRKLGEVTVSPEDFVFTSFEEEQPKCEEGQVMCLSRQCVRGDARCNGVRDCNDKSDEEGCPTPTFTPALEPAFETVTVPLATSSLFTTIPTTTTTTTSTTTPTTTTPTPEFGSGDGEEPEEPIRADDVFSCEHGDGKYYGDQKCDGTRDCKDGSDEAHCFAPKCAQGEFGCDLNRCLPMSSRCDGLSDCEDETDEQECYSCSGDAFHCDNSKCIQTERVCDGDPDCRDGSDEICKGSETHGCLPSDFDCGDGQCIPNYLRCSQRAECSNGEDERNCPGEASQSGFRCGSGESIRLDQRCDREYDCRDQSDEKNCRKFSELPLTLCTPAVDRRLVCV